ncbi:MAG: FtsH protease activity modulator HflK [Caulobacter sp.]|nr:FtsH protease activity modulator HflK [Caulobacter sp.]
MPWNDNVNPGPWGSPPPNGGKGNPENRQTGGPRGPGGRGPGTPPDLNDLQRRLVEWLRGMNNGAGGGGGSGGGTGGLPSRRILTLGAGALAALFFASGFIVVGARQEAVVTTFGAWTRSYNPGIGYHLPIIERAEKVDITTIRETQIGGAPGAEVENLMLTGDENIVDLSFTVQWRVANPGRYLFNIDDPEKTIEAVAESAMREIVGRKALDPIISRDRGQIQIEVQTLMQEILDSYQAGIIIEGVQISDAGPPKEVVGAFRDVNNASQNAESFQNEARGKAAEIRQQAIGYRAQVVREAAGEAARFNQVYEQYRLAPGVTRDRLYIETMERVLAASNKVIIDGKGVTAPIVLSPDLFKPRVATTAQPQVRSQGGAQ